MIEFIYFFGYLTLVFELVFFHVPSVANTQNFFKKNTNYGNSQSLLLHNIYSWSVPKKILLLAFPFAFKNAHQDAKYYKGRHQLFEKYQLEVVNCILIQWPLMLLLQLITFGMFNNYQNNK